MTLKRYTADSFLEAFLQAQEELGEDMIVVTSGTIQQNKFGGIYRTTVWELTAMPGKTKSSAKTVGIREAPAKPVVSEEIFMPAKERPRPFPRPPSPVGIAGYGQPNMVHPPLARTGGAPESSRSAATSPGSHQSGLRGIHTIRSNQIGDHEPQVQREENDEKNVAKLQAMLGEILKNRREPSSAVANEPAVQRKPVAANIPPSPVRTGHHFSKGVTTEAFEFERDSGLETLGPQDLEGKINDIFAMLRQMKGTSDRALSTPSSSLPDGLRLLRERLVRQEAPEDFIDEVIDKMREILPLKAQRNPDLVWEESCSWLRDQLKFCSPPIDKKGSGPMIIVLMGPTGVGKTTTIAKLAASFALDANHPKKVALFTIDTYRIGASAQLSQYAQIIEADMEILLMPDEVGPALDKHLDKDIILVDTAGRSQKSHRELQDMQQFLECFPSSVKFLVLSATTKFSDMVENERRFGELGYDHFIFTKTDETNSFGGLLALMYRSQSPLAYLTHGQSVPDDFRKAGMEFFLSQMTPSDCIHQNL